MSTDLALMPKQSRMTGVLEVVQHLDQLWSLAEILVRSRMLPDSIKTPEAAVAIILKGHELGIGTMAAFAGITVIQGKPTVSPQLMLALINRSGLMEGFQIEDDGRCCSVTMKRVGREPQTSSFSMDDARDMKLAGKDNWTKMPAIMRQWRATAACARVAFPDVIDGMYTPEELGADINDEGELVHHINGEIIEAEVIAPPQKSAPGLFTKAHVEVTKAFNDWMTKKCGVTNDAWNDEWHARITKHLEEGHTVPEKIDPAINPWQAKAHLLKWAIESGRIPDVKAEATRTRQTDAYVAALFYRSDEDKAAVKAEMVEYVAEQRRLKSDAIYRKNPDIAPAGWAEEQQEAIEPDRGDAYEPTEQDMHDMHETMGNA